LKQVLFVCIGNTCRSPMAEGLANHYGSDVLLATSAGLSPVESIAAETVKIMYDINIDVSRHVPMLYEPHTVSYYDLVVNMSGFKLPGKQPKELIEWKIEDPYRRPEDVYVRVRGDLEQRVMQLILRLRKRRKG
jgi:arsenate reductase